MSDFGASATTGAGTTAGDDDRQRVIDALFSVAAERPWPEVTLSAIAAAAGMSLQELRALYPSRIAILAAFAERMDTALLDAADPAMADQPPRERALDVLMSRFEALAPYKAGLRGLARSARRDPALAAALARIGCISHGWTLAAAGLEATGPRSALRGAGLALVFARVMPVWLDDDEPGLAHTMAALDRALERGATTLHRIDRIAAPLCDFVGRVRAGRTRRSAAEEPTAMAGDGI